MQIAVTTLELVFAYMFCNLFNILDVSLIFSSKLWLAIDTAVQIHKGGNITSTVYHGLTNATSDEDRAYLFNKYFYSVFTHSTLTIPPASDLPTLNSTITCGNIGLRGL